MRFLRNLKTPLGYSLYLLLGAFRSAPLAVREGNLLLINLNGIGDVLVSTSVLQSIRKRFPGRRIALVTHENASTMVQGSPFVDTVYVHKPGFAALLRFISFCRAFDPEYVLSLNPGYKNALLTIVSRGKRKMWFLRESTLVDWLGARGCIETLPPGNLADYATVVARRVGCDVAENHRPRIEISESNRVPLQQKGSGPLVLFIGGKWAWKKWGPEKFAELARRLCPENDVLVCGGKGDEETLERVRIQAGERKEIDYILVENVQQLASVIGQAVLLVTTDTIALHVATAMGTKAVALFGPTDPAKVLAGDTGHAVVSKRLPCQPCYSVMNGKGRCDQPVPSHCLKSITAEEVASAIGRML